ncbi:efflux RND transporter periplasmic adaptor subunit [Gemmatimonas aurantiaca]|uniref:efflux RND transporter periplasmic adaptor subunit n=1 Tax=Gemmatimonas aurantiaca TaxID=173480 RepID=UPI00301CEAE1
MRSSAVFLSVPSPSSPSARRLRQGRMMPIVFLLIFAALLAAGLLPRLAQSRARAEESTRSTAAPTVFTEVVKRDTASTPFELPATITGLHETSIFARTNGFVRELRVDIGSPVRAGDTLVVLDMPELREQERQASAVIEQTEASARLARTSLERWKQLATQGVVTPQELDERTATANVTEANARAAHANLANLRELQRFGVLRAPFHGVVTARSIDIGSLVVAGAAAGARPLLTVVQTDTLRVMLQIPQSGAARVRAGTRATVVVQDIGNAEIAGTVVRTAGAIDPVTRTLLTEVRVPNPMRRLLPGMFATVRLSVPSTPSLRIPAIALIMRADGPQVARVRNDTVALVQIALGRDYGTTLEVLGGLDAGDQIVVNPAESIASGQKVNAMERGRR